MIEEGAVYQPTKGKGKEHIRRRVFSKWGSLVKVVRVDKQKPSGRKLVETFGLKYFEERHKRVDG